MQKPEGYDHSIENNMASSGMRTYRQILIELKDATRWLKELGLYYDVTRIGQYERDIATLAEHFENGTLQTLLDKRKYFDLVNSLNEATEIINIHNGLCNIRDPNLLERLKRFIHGPFAVVEERESGSSYQARDIAFELTMASRYVKANFEVDFGTEADLRIFDNEKMFFIECKRPKSTNSIRSNVHNAFKQLNKRYDGVNSSVLTRGIVALSIGKVINPDQKLLYAKSQDTLYYDSLPAICQRFALAYSRYWQNELDNRTIGVLLYLQTPAVLENRNLITVCDYFAADSTSIPGSSDYRYFMNMAIKLAQGVVSFD